MRFVRILPAVALVLNAAALGGQEARPKPLAGDAFQVVAAALDRYVADNASRWSREGKVTLVLAPVTTGMAPAPPDQKGPHPGEPRTIALRPRQIDLLQSRLGTVVKTCDHAPQRRGWNLCGIPQPWHWLHLSNPWIDGAEAQVIVLDTWIEFGPLAFQPDGSGFGRTTLVYLKRDIRGWHVVRSVVIGVT